MMLQIRNCVMMSNISYGVRLCHIIPLKKIYLSYLRKTDGQRGKRSVGLPSN